MLSTVSRMFEPLRIPDLTSVNRGLRILLIEDSESDAKIILDLLRKDRRVEDVAWAPSVEAASAMLDAPIRRDLIITDLNLPGESGVAFLRRLRRREQDAGQADLAAPTPVVVLTGSDRAADFHDVAQSDGNTFITKPDDYGALRAVLRDLVRAVIQETQLPLMLAAQRAETDRRPLDATAALQA